jgi:hypothetical protein
VATPLDNHAVAEMLRETGELLESQGANPFRARAYRHAGDVIDSLTTPVETLIATHGIEGLQKLPGIGASLSKSVEKLVRTGRLTLLDRLRGEAEPVSLLATIGGIGPVLARRLRDEAGISTLPELERALSSGRLSEIRGFGEKRVRMVRESLSGRLRLEGHEPLQPERLRREERVARDTQPSVEVLLDIDREYRERARKGELLRITPKRFNPTKEAWLPVLHTERDGQHYTALFSNTARAHTLGVTRDWVVIYRDEREGDGQWTVITSEYGSLHGRRLIRGREPECRDYYVRPSSMAEPHP